MPALVTLLAMLAPQMSLTPPVMSVREIGPATPITGGVTHKVESDGTVATLFLPDGYEPGKPVSLWIHFHTAEWFVVSEYQRAGFKVPILVFNLGQGSSTYSKPFPKAGTLQPFLKACEPFLGSPVGRVNITSFSAGFGAVRQIIQDPEVMEMVGKVVLSDSIYGSLDPSVTDRREVLSAHVGVWDPLADRALSGKAIWVVTTSQITPEGYAGSWEVAAAIVKARKGTLSPGDPESKAAKDPRYPLLRAYDSQGLHVWSYGGDDAMAHMTHPRHLAEVLRQLGPE